MKCPQTLIKMGTASHELVFDISRGKQREMRYILAVAVVAEACSDEVASDNRRCYRCSPLDRRPGRSNCRDDCC